MENIHKIQWHPAFCSAIRLELRDQKKELIFEHEYNLNRKPLQIDLLIIKKSGTIMVNNEIGRIFREHNIMEYKSPEDSLGIDEYYKTMAYACLYKSAGASNDSIKAKDITISLVRSKTPRKLFRFFEKENYKISNPYHGIYYIKKDGFFDTQVIVSKELDYKEHIWLKSLQADLNPDEIRKFIVSVQKLKDMDDQRSADSVMNVTMAANKPGFDRAKEGDTMSSWALRELMAPEIEAAVEIRFQTEVEARVEKAVQTEVEARVQKAVQTEVEKNQKEMEKMVIVAFENGLDEHLVRKLAPSIPEERLHVLKQRAEDNKACG